MTVKLETLHPGDWVTAMVWTGTSRWQVEAFSPIQGQVVRVNRKTVSVVWQHSGVFQRVEPHNLHESSSTPFWEN